MISPALRRRIQDHMNQWEAGVPWMYLDDEGLVTVGFGTMLATANEAAAVNFQYDKDGALATEPDIIAAYNVVHAGSAAQKAAAPENKFPPRYYEKVTDLRIAFATASLLRDTHIDADYIQLKLIYPEFDNFPDDAKVALFDMIYNSGAGHSKMRHHRSIGLRAFATMNADINRANWRDAAKKCQRRGISATRNQFVARLFNKCAVVRSGKP